MLPSWGDVRSEVLQLAAQGGILPFLGSGVSRYSPTSLPMGTGLLECALKGIFPPLDNQGSPLFDECKWRVLQEGIKSHSVEVILQGLAESLLDRSRLHDLYAGMANQDLCLEEAARQNGTAITPVFDDYGFSKPLDGCLYQFHGAVGGSPGSQEKEQRKDSLSFLLNTMGPRLSPTKRAILAAGLRSHSLLVLGYSGCDPDIWFTLDALLGDLAVSKIYWCVYKDPQLNDYGNRHLARLANRHRDSVIAFDGDLRHIVSEFCQLWGKGTVSLAESEEQQAKHKETLQSWVTGRNISLLERKLAYGWVLTAIGEHARAAEELEILIISSERENDELGRQVHLLASLFAGYARRELSQHRTARKHLNRARRLSQRTDPCRHAQALHKLGESLSAFESVQPWYIFPDHPVTHAGSRCLRRAIGIYETLERQAPKDLEAKQIGRAGLGNALLNLGQLYRRTAHYPMPGLNRFKSPVLHYSRAHWPNSRWKKIFARSQWQRQQLQMKIRQSPCSRN